jgi:glycosyltransferase involved in cell wall biosynthesis
MRRICYIIGSLEWCGTAVHLLAFLRELDRTRFDPWVVCLVESGPVGDEIRKLGIRVDDYRLRSGYSLPAALALGRMVADLKRTRTDIVQSYLFLDNIFAAFAGRAARVRAIVTGRRTVDEWERPHRVRAYRLTNALIHRIAVVSPQVEASVLACERPPRRKVTLVRNALSREVLLARKSPEDEPALQALRRDAEGGFVYGTVGNIRHIKGHDVFVRAFADVVARRPDSHLVIVGDGVSRPEIEALVASLGLARSVHLVGKRTNVAAFLERFDVFVLPSRAEGMSNALLEAMLFGKASISSRFGLPVSPDGRDVVLPVDAGDPKALAAAMLRLRDDAALRAEMSSRAKAFAESIMDVGRMAREYEALYDDLVPGRHSAGRAEPLTASRSR